MPKIVHWRGSESDTGHPKGSELDPVNAGSPGTARRIL